MWLSKKTTTSARALQAPSMRASLASHTLYDL